MDPRVVLTLGRVTPERPRPKNHEDYRDRLRQNGVEAISIHPDMTPPAEFDALLLSGGGDIHPTEYGGVGHGVDWDTVDTARDLLEHRLLETALRTGVPIFGICRGFQMIAVHFGTRLVEHVDGHRERNGPIERHRIRPVIGSALAAICGSRPFMVNSRHHQAVEHVADPLTVSARVGRLVEAFEAPRHRLLAVQWHPETRPDDLLDTRPADTLFKTFVTAAKAHAAAR